MDIAPPNQHPATSDDELAKVLAGIGADDSAGHGNAGSRPSSAAEAAGLQFEETPGPLASATNGPLAPTPPAAPLPDAAAPVLAPTPQPTAPEPALPTLAPIAEPELTIPTLPAAPSLPTAPAGPLDDLKKIALEELRPLVGKLDLPPEDKFDTLLLIIRSTDDQSLLEPAHEAAKTIQDENKRAQALLDVIKEIDYFSQGGQPPQIAPLS